MDVIEVAEVEVVVLDGTLGDEHECVAKRCERAADWWFEHTCGMPTYLCGYHRHVLEERNARRGLKCRQCGGRPQVPIPWRPV